MLSLASGWVTRSQFCCRSQEGSDERWKVDNTWKLPRCRNLSGARQAFFTGLALSSFSASYREECLWSCLLQCSVNKFHRSFVSICWSWCWYQISDCLAYAHFAFSICEQLLDKSRWLSWTLFVAWHLDSSGHNCSSTAPRSNCRVHQLWHWLHIIDPYDGTVWRRGCRFYKPEADDWKKGLPWLASAAVFLFLFMWILLLLSFCHNAPQKAESDCGEEPLNVVEDLYVLVVLCCLYRFADFNIFPIAECMGSEPM